MHKTLIAVVILTLVGAGLYYVLTQYQPNPESASDRQMPGTGSLFSTDGEVTGTIVLINTEHAAVDGPYVITVRQAGGESAIIAVPSMGLPTCAAREKIADVYALQPGQVVSARGTVGEGGIIIPCESSEHFLSLVESN
ncbi:MAG TPA: hypothetical protein VEA36_01595 [Candidatus Paceibacterota bacterium]|nr:hypothetical protein [Candidatus Paceibacterota bacterium]